MWKGYVRALDVQMDINKHKKQMHLNPKIVLEAQQY